MDRSCVVVEGDVSLLGSAMPVFRGHGVKFRIRAWCSFEVAELVFKSSTVICRAHGDCQCHGWEAVENVSSDCGWIRVQN